MSASADPNIPAATKRHGCSCGCLGWLLGLGIVVILFCIALGPIGPSIQQGAESKSMQMARSISALMFSYSNDHDGKYPEGNSSTEIFQKLIDEQYATDPAVFYLPLPGKIRPVDGEKLKPENVGFDVTSGVDSTSSDLIPVVFSTYYKVTYLPGGTAVPIANSQISAVGHTWEQWWDNEKPLDRWDGISVAYKSNSATFLKTETAANGDRSARNFISPNYKPDDGHTYRQLTPDGPLP